MEQLNGEIRHYAWGSPTALPALLGVEPDGSPWAELWFGTNPGAPSTVVRGDGSVPLESVVGPLPFLVKFLAAGSPLSLQVHPDAEQARVGYAAEDAAGIALDAPERTYRDRSAKPEIIIAVSPFRALCGFRSADALDHELADADADELVQRVRRDGAVATATWLLTERPGIRPDHPTFAELDVVYPGDPGALVALLLNPVDLEPGEAVFLPAGQLHMYLSGLGVEVLGNSDNVVRGGLTPKHVDQAELVRITDPSPRVPPILVPGPDGWFDLPACGFAVQRLDGPIRWTASGPELVVFVEPDAAGGHPAGGAAVVPDGTTGEFGGGRAYRISRSRAS